MSTVVTIDLDNMKATVSPRVHEKYARKLVQDKLKAETMYKGGWTVWMDNAHDKTADHYEMTLNNPFYSMGRLTK